ncbi:MAG: hypothetical protein AB7S54_06825 [Bacteroidales bacterium]
MERFDEYFRDNRNLFDDVDLMEGHQERFMAKMKQRSNLYLLKIFISAAASVVLILMLTTLLGLFYNRERLPELANYFFGDRATQKVLIEMDSYYHSQLLRKYRAIEQLAFSTDPSVKPEVMRMFAEFEKEKRQLEGELLYNPREDYVVDAMMQNYQVRMEALQRIEESLTEGKP